jgi:aromatic ring-opening dioxygenase catalytic subunit (LigB family)
MLSKMFTPHELNRLKRKCCFSLPPSSNFNSTEIIYYLTKVIALKMAKKLLPVLFVSHGGGPAHLLDFTGSPFQAVDKNSASASFLRNLSNIVEEYNRARAKIQCILVVSAHWEEPEFTVEYQNGRTTKLLYDYYGFSDEAYAPHLTYNVKTHIPMADKVIDLLKSQNIPCHIGEHGYDHGVFMPLKMAYPQAQIPIVQVSLKEGLNMGEHIRLGELLRPLRAQGVLIIGSGQITHNLRELRSNITNEKKAKEFTEWICNLLENTSSENYERSKLIFTRIGDNAPHFYWAHPRPEHFLPLAVCFGAGYVPPEESVSLHQLSVATAEAEAIENAVAEGKFPVSVEGEAVIDIKGETNEEVDGEEKGEDNDEDKEEQRGWCKRIYHEIAMGSMAVDSYIFL